MRNLQRIILICMDTEILDFVQRDGLVFTRLRVGGDVFVGIRAEGADVNFAGGDCTVRVDLLSDPPQKYTRKERGRGRGEGGGGEVGGGRGGVGNWRRNNDERRREVGGEEREVPRRRPRGPGIVGF